MQTFGDYLRQEGLHQGNVENAKRMLKKGLDLKCVEEITLLSREELVLLYKASDS